MTKPEKKHAPAHPAPKALDGLALAARLIAGVLLVVSGSLKAAAPAEEFAVVIEMYNIVSPASAATLAVFLPWVELMAGWALLLGWCTRAAAAAALALFAAFAAAILSTKARGIDLPNCGCFGGGFRPAPMTMAAVDVVLSVLAFLAFKRGPGGPSLDNWSDGAHT